jgi:hypothetical protein
MGLARRTPRSLLIASVIAALALPAGAVDALAASDQPQVAVDKDGNAIYTFRRFDGVDIINTRVRRANGTLTAVQQLSVSGQDADAPQVAVDGQGTAVYVWVRFNGSFQVAQTRTRDVNGALTAVQDLSDGTSSAGVPQVAVDPQGNATYTWTENAIVHARQRAANGGLGPIRVLSSGGAAEPQVAVDPQGNASFVWRRFNGTNFVIQFRRLLSDGTLGAVQAISPSGQDSFAPQVAVDPQGNINIVWDAHQGANQVAQARRRSTSFGSVVDLSAVNATILNNPQVAVDPLGNAVFTWDKGFIESRRRTPSGGLSGLEVVSSTNINANVPQVAVDPTGSASFTWTLGGTTNQIIQGRRRVAEGFFSPIQDLTATGVQASQPQLGVDPFGRTVFVWNRGDIIQTRVRAPDGTLTGTQNLTG